MISYRGFMLWPDGRIEEVDGDGETYDYDPEPGLFDDLVTAGYPLHRDDRIGRWDGILDLRVDGSTVIAHTSGPESREHDMGAASELFLSWFRKAAEQ